MEFNVEPTESTILHVQLRIGNTGLYPRATLQEVDSLGTTAETIDFDEGSDGLYYKKWTAGSIRTKYLGQTKIYTDSGYTSESPIDRPVPFVINIGRYSSGGVFGSSGKKVIRTALNDEEIRKIVEAIMAELNPILEKKSEFNPDIQKVKTDVDFNDLIEIIKSSSYNDSNLVEVLKCQNIETINLIEEYFKSNKYDDSEVKSYLSGVSNLNSNTIKEILEIKGSITNLKSDLSIVGKLTDNKSKVYLAIDLIESNDYVSVYNIIKTMDNQEKSKLLNLIKGNKKAIKKLTQITKLAKILKKNV